MSNTISLTLVSVMLVLCFVALPATVHAAVYYVSPDGNDDAAGDRDNPWQSLTRANEALQPGDTAIFLPGEYAGPLSPVSSGTADAPITFRSAEPRAARLVPGEGAEIIRLDGHRYITIEDFHVDGEHRADWGSVTDVRHLTISGCEMRRARRTTVISDSSQVRLLDNFFSADRTSGDMLHLLHSSEVLFEGNSTTRVGHCPLRIANCFNVVLRANVFRAEWGRNYEFWHNGRLLIERNIITRARDSAGSADSKAKNLYEDSIFRQNLVFDNLHTPLNSGSYLGRRAGSTQHGWGPFVAVNNRFYHNTIADNLGHGWEIGGIDVSANVFKNNIFYRNDYAGAGTQVTRADGISRSNRFVTNILRGTEENAPVVRFAGDFWTAEEANQRTRTGAGFWSQFYENIDADPSFVDAEQRDYRLTQGSAAIDAGTPLTWALGEGTGRELPVTDGGWFYDGFGIEGEEGDFIAIGSGDNIAQIQRIEPRPYQPTILHLDREVSWEDAMPVSLPWAGAAPDLGAVQQSTSHPTDMVALARPASVEPGEPVSFSLDTFGKQVESVTWDFEDGSFSHETEPTHTFGESGHYGVTARVTFADGRRGVTPVFVHVPQRLDAQAPLVEVDFEDETRGDTWGYYFKFYRGHQTAATHVDRPEGEGRAMRIFYDADKRNSTAGQIAPGAWDIDRYPIVQFDYRIPEGVPVAIEVTPFTGPDLPRGFILGGTENRATRGEVLDAHPLIDDGRWHTITIDVRQVREIHPDLQYLRQFMFFTNWQEDEGQEFWFDEFSIRPAD